MWTWAPGLPKSNRAFRIKGPVPVNQRHLEREHPALLLNPQHKEPRKPEESIAPQSETERGTEIVFIRCWTLRRIHGNVLFSKGWKEEKEAGLKLSQALLNGVVYFFLKDRGIEHILYDWEDCQVVKYCKRGFCMGRGGPITILVHWQV